MLSASSTYSQQIGCARALRKPFIPRSGIFRTTHTTSRPKKRAKFRPPVSGGFLAPALRRSFEDRFARRTRAQRPGSAPRTRHRHGENPNRAGRRGERRRGSPRGRGGPGGAGRACSCPVRVMFEPTADPPSRDEVESSVRRVTGPSSRTGLSHRTCETKSLRPGLHR